MPQLPDADFLALLTQVASTISANLASYPGATAAFVAALGEAKDNFKDALDEHNIAQDAARAKTINKDEKRDIADALLRQMRDLVKANGVSDPDYAALGIPQAESSAPASATVPVATIDTSEPSATQ